MKIVIQCCSKKNPKAGSFNNATGQQVEFVAHPELCSPDPSVIRCRPDDPIDFQPGTWRDYLVKYNDQGINPDGLVKAGELYMPDVYKALIDKYGWHNVFILSAGWGLIRSDYLIPSYNITFSRDKNKPWITRKKDDSYLDFNQLLDYGVTPNETIYFFGGKSYLPLYYLLTEKIRARKVVYCCSENIQKTNAYEFINYGRRFTNWHYSCAKDFISNKIDK